MMVACFPSGKSAIQVSDVMQSTCKFKDMSTKFMDNWQNGKIARIVFPLCTNSYVFKVTCVVVIKILKREVGKCKVEGDYKTRLLNEVLCLAGANKLESHHKDQPSLDTENGTEDF